MSARTAPVDARLGLVPVSARSRLWIALLTFALPLALSTLLPMLGNGSMTSAWRWMRPGVYVQRWLEAWSGPAVIALVLAIAWLAVDRLVQRHRLDIDAGGIQVTTTLYRRRLGWAELDLSAARVIDIEEYPESRPLLKTSGVSLPGFRSGWFRSRNFSKLFVAIAGGSRLLRIPTRQGYALLLQPVDPNAVLVRLRELSGAARAGSAAAVARAR